METTLHRQSSTPDDVSIQVRHPHFKFDGTLPKYYVNNDAFRTHFLSALSLSFGIAEFFVCAGVRPFRDDIKDPKLKKELSAFLGQEAWHAREHDTLNKAVLEQGYKLLPVFNKIIIGFLNVLLKIMPKKLVCAYSAGIEHMTALFGRSVLLRQDRIRAEMHPVVADLIIWHAEEEARHKSVCFDVHKAIGGSHWARLFALVTITPLAGLTLGIIHLYLLAADGLLFKPSAWKQGINRMFNSKDGFFSNMLGEWLKFFNPNFNPWDLDDRPLLAQINYDHFLPKNKKAVTETAAA